MSYVEPILNGIKNGLTAKEIAVIVGCSVPSVYATANRYGIKINKADTSPISNYDAEIRTMRKNGYNAIEIAEAIGKSAKAVRKYCHTHNITIPEERKAFTINHKHTDDYVSKAVSEASNGLLEYVSGYTKKENPIKVRCVICGTEYVRTYHNIVHMKKCYCPECVEREKIAKEQARKVQKIKEQTEREARREDKLKQREIENLIGKLSKIHNCPVCGNKTMRPVYCSDSCCKKATNKHKEVKRRNVIQSVLIDKDITVKGLYKRDKGVCQICGRQCDTTDYVMRGRTFIAGDWYPSIDHIIPLSKGGEHSWDNVQLTHRRCNYLKSDGE